MIRPAGPVPGDPEIFRLVLTGKVYAPDAQAVESEIRKAVEKGAKNLLLACFSLEAVDSAVLSAIIAGLENLKSRKGGTIVFMGANETISRILQITKMDRFCPLVADETAALALLAAKREAAK
jgi:anti-anti-sigma factor